MRTHQQRGVLRSSSVSGLGKGLARTRIPRLGDLARNVAANDSVHRTPQFQREAHRILTPSGSILFIWIMRGHEHHAA
jgi:hypothetical protein